MRVGETILAVVIHRWRGYLGNSLRAVCGLSAWRSLVIAKSDGKLRRPRSASNGTLFDGGKKSSLPLQYCRSPGLLFRLQRSCVKVFDGQTSAESGTDSRVLFRKSAL